MRTLFPTILTVVMILFLMSCDDDAGKTASDQPSVIQFQSDMQALSEGSSDDTNVLLSLNHPRTTSGTVTLMIDENMQHRIHTTPAHSGGVLSLAVAKGASHLQFGVKAVDNALAEGDQTVLISLQPSPGFIVGEQKTFHLIVEDDDNMDDAVQSTASFLEQSEIVSESHSEPVAYKIILTPAAAIDSKVFVAITTDKADAFVTYPSMENNSITLAAPAGTTELNFTMQAIDNTEFDGDKEVEFSIISTEGSIVKGTRVKQKLTISDDELTGKLKGYESSGEGGEKRTYEYDTRGRISRIITESYAPHNPTTLTDVYFYDEQDRVIKINKWPGRDILYTWANNRIERADVYQDGVLIQYANYAYDEHGNMTGVEPFYKQNDGSFLAAGVSVYLYFTDGNLYKVLTYNNGNGGEPVLIYTRTYDQYLDNAAPIGMFDVLPTIKTQKKLAGTYRFEQHMVDLDETYVLTYEFRSDGQPSKRTASGPRDTQIVLYHYY